MNDQVKFIVERLNREPFKKNINYINFDNMQGIQLLQLLNDVFAEIDSKVLLQLQQPIATQHYMFVPNDSSHYRVYIFS